MTLINGDTCRLNDWVLFRLNMRDTAAPGLACVREISVPADTTPIAQYPRVGFILLQQAAITACTQPYRMPGVHLSDDFIILGVSVSNIFY